MSDRQAARTILICGSQSPYGAAHLQPLLTSDLDVLLVIYPSDSLCRKFSATVAGTASPIYGTTQAEISFIERLPKALYRRFRGLSGRISGLIPDRERSQEADTSQQRLIIVDDINTEGVIDIIRGVEPDWIISAAFPQLFSRELISLPRLGAVNFHPSLLPKFRGAHPIYWAIRSGVAITGLSAHFMTMDVDRGDLIHQRKMPISLDETYTTLYEKIVAAVPEFALEVASLLSSGNPPRIVQSDEDATYFRNDREIHHRIFWSLHISGDIDRIVRSGNGRAYFFWRGQRIQVLKATKLAKCVQLTNGVEVPPGVVVDFEEEGIVVKTLDSFVRFETCCVNGNHLNGQQIIKELKPYLGEFCT